MPTKTFLQLQLDAPCHETWDAMTPETHHQRHCQSCQRSVVDFSGMTDAQVIQYFKTLTQPVCGKFQPHQLGRTLEEVLPPRAYPYGGIALAAALTVLSPALAAQGTDRVPPPPPASLGACGGGGLYFAEGSSSLSGVIRNGATEEPLIGANVAVQDQYGHHGTSSDYNGDFKLRVSKTATALTISYIGYETQVLTLDGQTHFDVFLTPCAYPLQEIVVTSHRPEKGCILTSQQLSMGLIVMISQDAPARTRIDTADLYLQALNIFPNPSPATLLPRLSLDLEKERPLRIHIVDVAGRILWDTRWPTLAGTNTLDFPNVWAAWPVGTYYVVLEDEQGQKITKPVVKQ